MFLFSEDKDCDLVNHSCTAPCSRLAGECDFNFKESKNYIKGKKNKFNTLIGDDNELKSKLDFCNEMHHNFLNFSVMQSMGNMNGKKGSIKIKREEYAFDRADVLIAELDKFYDDKENCLGIFPNNEYTTNRNGKKEKANKDYLRCYLNSFDDIYNYCNQIYFIYDDVFIDELIENGKKPIKVAADVNRYMDLAMGFWGRKLIAFKKIDDFIEKDELDCEKEKLFEEIREMQEKHGDEIGNLIFERLCLFVQQA